MEFIFKKITCIYSLADFQFPILAWEQFFLVEPGVHAFALETRIQRADRFTVRMGVTEEDF